MKKGIGVTDLTSTKNIENLFVDVDAFHSETRGSNKILKSYLFKSTIKNYTLLHYLIKKQQINNYRKLAYDLPSG
jgi:hypothetical protein